MVQNYTNKMETEEKQEKKQWGGKRAGSGRKKTVHGKYYGFNSTPETDAILQSISTSKTDFINEAILAYAKSKS